LKLITPIGESSSSPASSSGRSAMAGAFVIGFSGKKAGESTDQDYGFAIDRR
jgi:hypothetical protein